MYVLVILHKYHPFYLYKLYITQMIIRKFNFTI